MSKSNCFWRSVMCFVGSLTTAILLVSSSLAQTTISTGSIVGTVTDPTGAVVSDAKVTITDRGTGAAVTVTTTSTGTYASGSLLPGKYDVKVEAKGFKTTQFNVDVQVNTTATGNIKLDVGESSQVVEVQVDRLLQTRQGDRLQAGLRHGPVPHGSEVARLE